VFVIGGTAVRPFVESAMGAVLEDSIDRGARCVLMDIAGSGGSLSSPATTMDAWLADIEEVFLARVREPAAWTGASIGAWLMLRIHARHPEWFRAMCALAPAFDWDQAYVGPRLADGRLGVIDGTVVNPDATALATRELLVSMAAHHVLREPPPLTAPLHVIFGGRDEMAPAATTMRFMEMAHAAPCTGELLPDADHGVAKLDPPQVMLRYQAWLRAQLGAHR
jgi:pimeloyl-ACP methyl ester carboxylesterase